MYVTSIDSQTELVPVSKEFKKSLIGMWFVWGCGSNWMKVCGGMDIYTGIRDSYVVELFRDFTREKSEKALTTGHDSHGLFIMPQENITYIYTYALL